MGLTFHDNRFSSPRVLKNNIPSGEHEVIATSDESDFHIGAFCFERKNDGSVISKGYYHDEDGNPCVKEETYTSDMADEIYGHESIEFNGMRLYITPPEYVYSLKTYTRNEKDMHDIEFLDNKIDKERALRINNLGNTCESVEYVNISSIADKNNERLDENFESIDSRVNRDNSTFDVKFDNEIDESPLLPTNTDTTEKKSDIEGMMDEVQKEEEIKEDIRTEVKDKPKTLIKNNSNMASSSTASNEEGFTTKSTLISCIVLVVIVTVIVVAFYYITG